MTRYRRANVSAIVDMSSADASGPCLISAVYTRSCLYLHESFEACALRVGPARLQRVLFERCRASAYWRQWYVGVLAAGKAEGGPVSAARTPWAEAAAFVGRPKPQQLRHGPSTAAEVCSASRLAFEATSYGATFDANAFLDSSIDDNRHHRVGNRLPIDLLPPMGPPRHCRDGALHYPIAFGTPAANVIPSHYPKLFDFMPIPVDVPPKPLSMNDEDLYQALAALSYFCVTHARGGWDCGRHYEVMGAGCVPYFYDIRAAGPFILPHFPKKFLMEVLQKPYFSHIGHVQSGHYDQFSVPPQTPYAINDHHESWGTRCIHIFCRRNFRLVWHAPK